ncbi:MULTISPECIES: hypothetical protein [Streptomyces]|uniref:hypothetical protein n=1 Tax=Streptomyces TaxID=1883 RepID=UPI00073DD5C2|nr:hypothetical protein [Streptomyces sp. FBKL.4005]OYP10266.1 hypothetical protein CFC35_41490 [Streptomyces sp. FBKL.4005]CUW33410.1 hypothetical protein TUE45_pSRTUE45a_0042 [Streptomyces reticuli]
MGVAINVSGAPVAPGRPNNAIELARALGDSTKLPTKQLTDTPALIAQEQDMLLKCESAIENLRFAFWAAGKALQVVRDARLYRAQFETFEEYTQTRWDITPQYAGKLIRTWRVAEALFQARPGGGLETIVSTKLGYGHAWALVPLVEEHGVQAAVYLYLALVKIKGAGVTAALVQGAVETLPKEAAGHKGKTEEAVAAYLAPLEGTAHSTPGLDPAKAVRALSKAAKTFDPHTVQAALEHDPKRARTAVKSLIEALSSVSGVKVTFLESDTEAAALEGEAENAREAEAAHTDEDAAVGGEGEAVAASAA